jgi:hypothetical protein
VCWKKFWATVSTGSRLNLPVIPAQAGIHAFERSEEVALYFTIPGMDDQPSAVVKHFPPARG